MCVTTDIKALNSLTETDAYPVKDIRETIDWLSGKRVFSTFNLKDGYYQMEIAKESRPLNAVRTVLGLLQYTRLVQGLKNSPGTFQRTVNTIMADHEGKYAMTYVDKASIGTVTEQDHLLSLQSLLKSLFKAGLRLKLSKCRLWVRRVEVLGHEVGPERVKPSADHLKAVRNLVEPAGRDELMRFLGLANFFACFIDHFAMFVRPLYSVLKGTGFARKCRKGHKLVIQDWNARWGEPSGNLATGYTVVM